ncbi:glycosyltransferase family 2 protein [Algoriphagus sp. NG3]|uniref:glycosyltransferase family 2 protein n=1 Tax=Algoriphagus sp. NG3 TaxID=3097546 RepID=UPI002A8271D0|nr:glycosyltransferase family 2 protein [Algoriphagus sp. NG3]WPR77406.1 glycosyltransferase family 2 protein [Algoriphagus sp. NG3]
MTYNPKVSILVPNYNKLAYLRETLNSVLTQTYTNWECIIVDDHSTDRSWEILESYSQKDSRIMIFKRPKNRKRGGNAARNYAFEQSSGDYIQWLDSDDLLCPMKIELQIQSIYNSDKENVSIVNWYSFESSEWRKEFLTSSENKRENKRWDGFPDDGIGLLLKIWSLKTFIPPHAYLISRNCHIHSGGWDESLVRNQDGEYFTRVLVDTEKLKFVDTVLAFYRRPDVSHKSRSESFESYSSLFESLVKCKQSLLRKKDHKQTRQALSQIFESYFIQVIGKYPQLAQKSLGEIKLLNSSFGFNFSKSKFLLASYWLGVDSAIRLRRILVKINLFSF